MVRMQAVAPCIVTGVQPANYAAKQAGRRLAGMFGASRIFARCRRLHKRQCMMHADMEQSTAT